MLPVDVHGLTHAVLQVHLVVSTDEDWYEGGRNCCLASKASSIFLVGRRWFEDSLGSSSRQQVFLIKDLRAEFLGQFLVR